MAIELDGDFTEQFERLKASELKKVEGEGEFEVGVYFEKNFLASLSFNRLSGPWSDNYWIIFPNPEKLTWQDVRKALQAGFRYLINTSYPTSRDLGMLD